jgi:hypothetical protein
VVSERKRERQGTGSGMVAGLRARFATGPKFVPEVQFIFILLQLFSFSISGFLFEF